MSLEQYISLEKHIQKTVLKTALLHLLKNPAASKERICRNIQELISGLYPQVKDFHLDDTQLADAVKRMDPEELLVWLLAQLP